MEAGRSVSVTGQSCVALCNLRSYLGEIGDQDG